jgi:hypothetical protein
LADLNENFFLMQLFHADAKRSRKFYDNQSIFYDFAKAFDMVDHEILLNKIA